jgi:DnaK suppressor protein
LGEGAFFLTSVKIGQIIDITLSNHGAIVTSKQPRFDPAFIEKQRRSLMKLRATLLNAGKNEEADEGAINSASVGGAMEYEDDAQKMALLELDGELVARDIERAARIDRALQKIEDGTYGFSDLSGQRIPQERLEAVPESIYTVAEQASREK